MKRSVKAVEFGRSVAELLSVCEDAARNAVVLCPKVPTAILADSVVAEMEAPDLAQLGALLAVRHVMRLIQQERAKASAAQRRRIPGYEHLPLRIRTADGKMIPLLSATYSEVRGYYRAQRKKSSEQRANDPKLIETKKLLDEMSRKKSRHKGDSVQQLLNLDDGQGSTTD